MKLESIPLDEIDFGIVNAKMQNIDLLLPMLENSIKAIGILQPITVFQKSDDGRYEILDGKRRFHAYNLLNEKYSDGRYEKIQCIIVPEPDDDVEKSVIAFELNFNRTKMSRHHISMVVTRYWNEYHDYDIVQKKLGISKHMVKKYVKLSRLPRKIKDAIDEGRMGSNREKAMNITLKAVDAFGWEPGNDVDVNMVIDFAKEFVNFKDERELEGERITPFWRYNTGRQCPNCGNKDREMINVIFEDKEWFCTKCDKKWNYRKYQII